MPRPPRRARACMRASERTARSHERPRSTPLSEGRFDPPHAAAPGHDAVGVAQRGVDPREPSAHSTTSGRPAAQNSVAAAPRLITNAPNARRSATPTPQMAVLDVSGLDSSRPDGARPRAGRAGKMVVGPGCARAAPLALAARDAPKASWRERGACGHATVWQIFTRFYRGCCEKLSRHRCTARPRQEQFSTTGGKPDRTIPAS